MKLIACKMTEDELTLALHGIAARSEIVWLERGLHNTPQKLHAALQAEIDRTDPQETVLLTFSQCGNAALGLTCSCDRLVMPRYADCIHILLHGKPDVHTIYASRGWLEDAHAMHNEYRSIEKKYGASAAKSLYREMLAPYRSFAMIDTGAYDLASASHEGKRAASLLGLSYEEVPGSIAIFRKLLSGQWDEEFLVLRHGQTVKLDDFLPELRQKDGSEKQ